MTIRGILGVGSLALLVAACSSSSGNDAATGGGGAGGVGGEAGAGGGAAGAGGSDAGISACPKQYGTVVIVGDSISDVGAGKELNLQQPFYRELIVKNDDAMYAAWTGKDLTACWSGAPNVVKVSKGGAQTPDLVTQVKGLPATLPGPVLIFGTIGGNDVQAALPQVVLGQDVTPQQNAFQQNLDDAFGEVTKADRFGAGVKVDVLITNVFDPSDGTGDFSYGAGKCPGILGFFPANMATDPLLQPWNDIMSAEGAKYPGVKILDLHTAFHGHGTAAADTWFYSDCIHPNTAGHEAIRELFWPAIASEP